MSSPESSEKQKRLLQLKIQARRRTVLELANDLKPPAEWDYLIVGDGSGSSWGKGVGWAATLISKKGDATTWNGGANSGTVTTGELMAYVLPLTHLSTVVGAASPTRPIVNVHVYTDSQYLFKTSGIEDRYFHKNGAFWAFFDAFARGGVLLHWHWRRRDSSAFNVLADGLSRQSRLAVPIPAEMRVPTWKALQETSRKRVAKARAKRKPTTTIQRQDADDERDQQD